MVSLSDEIMQILENNPNMQFNSRAVFNYIHGSKSTSFKPSEITKITAKIRTELKRLSDRKKIARKTRGFYQAKPLPHVIQKLENPDIKIHGIKIECELPENNTFGILPITAQNNIFDDWLIARGFEATTNNRYGLVKWWENRKITFTVHVSGLFEIFVRASDSPLCFSDWVRLLNWLNGFFDPLVFDASKMFVRQIGYNRDFRLLRLEGVSSVSLQVMNNLWSQVYQKGDAVRFEHHLSFPRLCLNVDDVARSLLLLTVPLGERVNGVDNNEGMFR